MCEIYNMKQAEYQGEPACYQKQQSAKTQPVHGLDEKHVKVHDAPTPFRWPAIKWIALALQTVAVRVNSELDRYDTTARGAPRADSSIVLACFPKSLKFEQRHESER